MKKQLLWLMFIDSLDVNNRKMNNRVLRSNGKYIFEVNRKIGKNINDLPII